MRYESFYPFARQQPPPASMGQMSFGPPPQMGQMQAPMTTIHEWSTEQSIWCSNGMARKTIHRRSNGGPQNNPLAVLWLVKGSNKFHQKWNRICKRQTNS